MTTHSKLASQLLEDGAPSQPNLYDQLVRLQQHVLQLQEEVSRLDWDDTHVEDQEIGEHLNAFVNHLDNAVGRLSTLIHAIRRKKRPASRPKTSPFAGWGRKSDE